VTNFVRALARSLAALAVAACASRAGAQAVPASVELSPAVRLALQSAALTDDERAALRLRHGTYDDGDLPDARARAVAALGRWDLDSPALTDAAAPPELRAEALVRRGDAEAALPLVDAPTGVHGKLVRARALDALGRAGEAIAAAREAKRLGELDGAARDDRMDAVEATALLARLEGRPARDWQAMLDALAVLRDEDRLDPRPRLLEGRLLVEKDRFREGVEALREALARDLRSAEAMHLLGRVAVQTFDFDGARRASGMLRSLGAPHALADLLDAESALQSRDAAAAIAALVPIEERMPAQRQALALRAAAEGMRFDDTAMEARLDALDGLMPGSPLGHYECGRFLSLARQYEEAADALGEAARRAPGWSAPIAELGLLEMQSGRDAEALAALRRAVELDPFDQRARHSLTLAEDLSTWTRRESEHFVVRCKPGLDEALATWMPSVLDAVHGDVAAAIGHAPARKTVIELHPDHKSFAVRITGMPSVHTMAASTGPLIALEAPREGAPQLHLGRFDWEDVLRHEYVHTVTLDRTRNRIPHWFTEALATRLETKPRSFDAVQLLARAFDQDQLLGLDEIGMAFVRPKRADDRQLAYTQGAWMAEFIESAWGQDAIRALLGRYRDGATEAQAFAEVLGIDRDEFMKRFQAHAERDLRAWGMLPEPSLSMMVEEVRAETGAGAGPVSIDDARLAAFLDGHPEHPDLLEMSIRRAIKAAGTPDAATLDRLRAYARVRPVDPWPHRELARAALAAGDGAAAIPHLEFIDAREGTDPGFALELARLERARGNRTKALTHATKAARIDAYTPSTREFAAALAVEAGDLQAARMHVQALGFLEPGEARHQARLARIDELIAGAR
jgi:tetratricopeptide (TPR) repeat protein